MAFTHRSVELIPHPQSPPGAIHRIDVRWFQTGAGQLVLRWVVNGVEALAVPSFAGKGRGEDLWRTTCGELFLRNSEGGGYRELNFSPSGRWAAYSFDHYREGMAEIDIPVPEVSCESGQFLFVLTAVLDAAVLDGSDLAGVSAVIEETDGTTSYWAVAHPPGKPDFHDAACFALPLPTLTQA
jgi:hypothetical protein